MKRENEYIKNTVILLIGKFSSQIISFLLLPLFTNKLSTDNFGYIDLIQTYISLLAPVFLLQLDSSVFRYLIDCRDNEEKKKQIISSATFCIVTILCTTIIISYLINCVIRINYYQYIVINMVSLIINTYVMSIARGNGHNKVYSIASIITATITLIVNLFLILLFEFDAKSILIASSIANISSAFYVYIRERIKIYIKPKSIDKKIIKKLLRYSIPMIPNVLSWWIVGMSDRTMIVYFISVSANGVYSVSCKFSNLLNSFFSIFSLSWQETASLHINEKDCGKFFSKMILNIYNLFIVISCLILGFLPVAFDLIIGKEFIEAYKYIPILLGANLLSVLVGLFGGIYVAKKMTKKVAVTTIYSAIINILINLLLIKKIGLHAACLSTLIAYFVMAGYRYYDVKRIINIKLKFKDICRYMVLFFALLIPYYLKLHIISLIGVFSVILFYFIDNKAFVYEYIINKSFKKIIN